ncbi:hypothetical protein EDB89DRAFT_1907909 [Lactarius sanguifluus]|nr:hypothetical protein EDB89DRAFT_1907909 [Lactarius sanguifluus]
MRGGKRSMMFMARVSQGGGQKSISTRRISTRKLTMGGTMIQETCTQYQRIVGCPREEAEAHVCQKDLRQEFDYMTQQTHTYFRQIISKKHNTRGEKAVNNVCGKVSRKFDMHREKAVDDVRSKVSRKFDVHREKVVNDVCGKVSRRFNMHREKAADDVRGKVSRKFDMHREKAANDVRGKVECLKVEAAEVHVHLKDLKKRS